MPRQTKEELATEIEGLLNLHHHSFSTGSTEPKALFEDIAGALGIPVRADLTKVELAQKIAESGGQLWDDSCDSRNTPSGGGETVTAEGIKRVLAACRRLHVAS
jgi:hypothetical protein